MSPVVVVGAGPTGLLAAVGLARRGVDVQVLERRTAPDPTTRALSVWGRACEVLEQHGVDRAALESASVPVRRLTYFTGTSHLATFTLPAGAPCRTLPQQRTEALLADRLAGLGVPVRWGVDVTDLEQTDEGVRLQAATPTGPETLDARYVVAADGARSVVRKRLGIGFEGETMERRFAVVDARLAEGDLAVDACLFYQSPTGPLVVVPMGDGVFRFLCSVPADGPGAVGAVVRERGLDVRLGEVVSSAVFTVHAREARQYREGRVFLAGDAAHIHSPAGGQGMNNGLQDAHNLAWKLAAVVVDGAPESVLGTYEPERRAATRRIIADTTHQTTWWMLDSRRAIAVRDLAFRLGAVTGLAARRYGPVLAGYRTCYPTVSTPAPEHRCARRRALGRLRGGPLVDGWSVTAREPATVAAALGPLAQEVAVGHRSDECRAGGVTLVRPDGHAQWHGHAEDLPGLLAELAWWGVGPAADRAAPVVASVG